MALECWGWRKGTLPEPPSPHAGPPLPTAAHLPITSWEGEPATRADRPCTSGHKVSSEAVWPLIFFITFSLPYCNFQFSKISVLRKKKYYKRGIKKRVETVKKVNVKRNRWEGISRYMDLDESKKKGKYS